MPSGADHAPLIYVAGRAAGLLLAPVAVILLPALLGDDGYGRYSYWFGLISVYLVLFDLGTAPMLRRYLPELAQLGGSRALFRTAMRLKFIPLALIGAGAALQAEPGVALTLMGAGLLAALATNLADVSYAYQHMGMHSIAVLGRRVLRLLLVPTGFLLWGLSGILVALVLTEALALLLALPAARLMAADRGPLPAPFLDYYRQGLWVFGAMLISVLLGRLPVFAAEWSHLPAEAVGRIALAVDLTYFALKELLNSLSEAVLPRLITHSADGRDEHFRALLALNLRVVNIAGIGIGAIGIGLAGTFLSLLGAGFAEGERAFQLLLPVPLLGGWILIYNQLLLVAGRSHLIIVNHAAGLLIALLITALGWPHPSVEHLALALLVGSAATTLLAHWQARPLTGPMNTLPDFLRLLPGAGLVLTGLLAWPPLGVSGFLIGGVLAVLSYLGLALATGGIPRQDLILFRRALLGGTA